MCSIALFSCDTISQKLTVTPDTATLYSEGTVQISTNANDATFESKDEFYASVEASGKITANKIGKTEIIVNSSYGSATIPVTVIPKYTLYSDVDGLIGKSRTEVINRLGSNYQESTSSSGDKLLTYLTPTSYCDGFVVTISGGKCKNILAMVSTSYTSMLTKALLERYSAAGMQNDYFFFLNHDENVLITLMVYNTRYLAVYYIEYDPSKTITSGICTIPDEMTAVLK